MPSRQWSLRKNKKLVRLMIISYVGNTIAIFGYFYPLNPIGASIYFGWFTLGWALFFSGLPRVADVMDWVRLLKKRIKRSR